LPPRQIAPSTRCPQPTQRPRPGPRSGDDPSPSTFYRRRFIYSPLRNVHLSWDTRRACSIKGPQVAAWSSSRSACLATNCSPTGRRRSRPRSASAYTPVGCLAPRVFFWPPRRDSCRRRGVNCPVRPAWLRGRQWSVLPPRDAFSSARTGRPIRAGGAQGPVVSRIMSRHPYGERRSPSGQRPRHRATIPPTRGHGSRVSAPCSWPAHASGATADRDARVPMDTRAQADAHDHPSPTGPPQRCRPRRRCHRPSRRRSSASPSRPAPVAAATRKCALGEVVGRSVQGLPHVAASRSRVSRFDPVSGPGKAE